MYAYRQAHRDDRPHQRRYKHRTNNHRRRIGVQAQRRHEYRHYQNEYIGAPERYTRTYHGLDVALPLHIVGQRKIVFKIVQHLDDN